VSYFVSTFLNAHVRLLSVGLQYFTFRLIKHMVDGRISVVVRISKFQIRAIPRPQLLDPRTVDHVRKQQQLMSINDCVFSVHCSLTVKSE